MVTWTTIEPIDSRSFFESNSLEEICNLLSTLDEYMFNNYPTANESKITDIQDEKQRSLWHLKTFREDYALMSQYNENHKPSYWFADHNFYIHSCDIDKPEYHFTAPNREQIEIANANKWLHQLQAHDKQFNQFKVRHNYEY